MDMYLTQSLHRALRASPERMATLFQSRRTTYRDFVGRVARLAGALRAIGLQPNDRVAMLSLNSDRYLEYFMASFWAGGVAMPVNTRWTDAEILYALDDCKPHVLIVDDNFLPRIASLSEAGAKVPHLVYAGDDVCPTGMHSFEHLAATGVAANDALRSGDDLALLLYTGGTTGFPKGVMLSHANMYSATLGMAAIGCSTSDIYLHAAPMFHMADL